VSDPLSQGSSPGRQPRNHVGTVSLLIAVAGAVATRLGMMWKPFPGDDWLPLIVAGFDAALVGGLADWFAVTALFRHPLGLPIPHTAIIPKRRDKIIDGIATMVQEEWLSADVIGARLARLSPSQLVVEWLQDEQHVERIGAPLRDVVRGLARMLVEPEITEFVERAAQSQLRELPIDASTGRWLVRAADSESLAATFQSAAQSLANLAGQPASAVTLQRWLERAATELRRDGKRLVPMLLRRKLIQRTLIEAACDYAARELSGAAAVPDHPFRTWVFGRIRGFGERLAAGDPQILAQVEQLRGALADSIEVRPMVQELLQQLRAQLDRDLGDSTSYLSRLIDRTLREGVLQILDDAERRVRFDRWVQTTVQDLLNRHRHQIGLTVRENLEALDTATLVAQIEARVGNDLQFIRLNGALVGGLIGITLAALHALWPY